jgi:hypothetical protein
MELEPRIRAKWEHGPNWVTSVSCEPVEPIDDVRDVLSELTRMSNDPLVAQVLVVYVDLLRRISDHALGALSSTPSARRTLERLTEARKKLTPRGAPRRLPLESLPVEIGKASALYKQFVCVMGEVDGGEIDSESARKAVIAIRETLTGGRDENNLRNLVPALLRELREMQGDTAERVLRDLSRIRRPGNYTTGIRMLVAAKFGVTREVVSAGWRTALSGLMTGPPTVSGAVPDPPPRICQRKQRERRRAQSGNRE